MNYREAILLEPGYARAHDNLGDALMHLRRYTDAEAACREALRLDPEDPVALSSLGEVMRARQAPGRRR